mmetsp:Transcript_2650/g.11293  ORF Transcript_2650/g.11293 Transcript_2650/m.11293 type:complete len:203 (-) Transcript_2650:1377-1985(-)
MTPTTTPMTPMIRTRSPRRRTRRMSPSPSLILTTMTTRTIPRMRRTRVSHSWARSPRLLPNPSRAARTSARNQTIPRMTMKTPRMNPTLIRMTTTTRTATTRMATRTTTTPRTIPLPLPLPLPTRITFSTTPTTITARRSARVARLEAADRRRRSLPLERAPAAGGVAAAGDEARRARAPGATEGEVLPVAASKRQRRNARA